MDTACKTTVSIALVFPYLNIVLFVVVVDMNIYNHFLFSFFCIYYVYIYIYIYICNTCHMKKQNKRCNVNLINHPRKMLGVSGI